MQLVAVAMQIRMEDTDGSMVGLAAAVTVKMAEVTVETEAAVVVEKVKALPHVNLT